MKLLLSCLLALALLTPAQADIYKWVDAKGELHFSDQPPEQAEAAGAAEVIPYTPPPINELPYPNREPIPVKREVKLQPVAQYVGKAQVTIYSAQWCGVCTKAKAYMNRRGIPYTEYDIDASVSNLKNFQKLGGRGVPLLLVGQQRMAGFSAARLEAMLARGQPPR